MNFKLIGISILAVVGLFVSFLSQYKKLILYVVAMGFFLAVTIKVVKNIAMRKNAIMN